MPGGAAAIDNRYPVWLSRLKLNHFRNYERLSLNVGERHVVLSGDNGAGKTNLLEAVSLLSPGRGLRRAKYEMLAHAANSTSHPWSVNAELNAPGGPVSIGTGQTSAGEVQSGRVVRIDQQPAKLSDELLEHSRVLWLTPAQDGLFTGPTSDRRRFLDRLVLAIDPQHGRRVSSFDKLMRQRNRLLEDTHADPVWLAGIEQQMAEAGTAIASARIELVSLLRTCIEAVFSESLFPKAVIALEGTLETALADQDSIAVEDQYLTTLSQERYRDRAAGRTLTGPHRTNLAIRHGPKDMEAALCSTGEQKALLIGLVLAHSHLVGDIAGMTPILLLDEVAAHLDTKRRAALFSHLDEISTQTWMTGTDRNLFEALEGRADYFTVNAGEVIADE